MPDSSELTTRKVVALSLQVGTSTSVSAVAFILGGLWMDRKFSTSPLGIIAGGALGLIVALSIVWQIVKPLQKMK